MSRTAKDAGERRGVKLVIFKGYFNVTVKLGNVTYSGLDEQLIQSRLLKPINVIEPDRQKLS